MAKRNVMTIRVPQELKERLEMTAHLQGVSLNQFTLYAFTKELAELEANESFRHYLQGRKQAQMIEDFDKVMAKIPPRPVPDWDSLED